MKKVLLIALGAFTLLSPSTAQAEVNGTFNITENWTVTIDYKNFGPNKLTTKKTFNGSASGAVVVNNGQYKLIDKVTAVAGPIPWQQLAENLKARTLSQSGETFTIAGNIVFGEGTKVITSPPYFTFQGMALLGFFGVPITVDQSEFIASAPAPVFFHATGPANALNGGGTFPNQEANIVVTSQITIAAKPPEIVKPVAKIISPAKNAHLTTPNVTIQGTATDNVGIALVTLTIENSSGTNSFDVIPTGSTWSSQRILSPGANKIRAKAKDVSGNFSAEVISTIYYDLADQLTVNVGPGGTLAPNLNSSNLVIGRIYTITAKPAAGFAFAGWNGGVTAATAALKFTMQQDLVLNASFTDVTVPTVTVTSHKASQRVLEPGITLQGAAKDNNQVSRVKVKLNDGAEQDASLAAAVNGVRNWSQPLTLTPGPNVLRVYSEDPSGKHSKTNTFTITYVVTALFNVTIQGNGKISPNLGGQRLEIGKKFTLTAQPAPGSAFVHWNIAGSISNKTALSFIMQNGYAPTAVFRDSTKPKLVIVAPKANAIITNDAPVTISGTASDNVSISRVLYRVDGGAWQFANGTTTWNTPPLSLSLGTHSIQVYALDAANNATPTNSVTFTRPTFGGIYLGTYTSTEGNGVVGVMVRSDRSVRLVGGANAFEDGSIVSASFNIRPDGTFSFNDDGGIVSGKVTGATISGAHPSGKFALTRRPDTGPQLVHVGYYSGSFTVMNGNAKVEGGPVEALVAADGQVLFSAASDGFTDAAGGAKGSLVGTKFSATVGGAPITGSIDSNHKITATFRTDSGNGTLTMQRQFGIDTAALAAASLPPRNSDAPNSNAVENASDTTLKKSKAAPETSALTPPPPRTITGSIVTPTEAPLLVIDRASGSIAFATEVGRTYTVQVSDDLVNWRDLLTFTAQADGYEIADPSVGEQQFYRVIVH